MKNIVTIAVAAAILSSMAGCQKAAESSTPVGVEFRVDRLFKHDGCTVYRFDDGGRSRYFAKCDGATTSSMEWRESCGKNCTRPVDVPTSYEPSS